MNKPADAFVYPKTNELFVADGYGNRRVIVFDADTGAFKRMWGAFGNAPVDAPPAAARGAAPARRRHACAAAASGAAAHAAGAAPLPAARGAPPLETTGDGPRSSAAPSTA